MAYTEIVNVDVSLQTQSVSQQGFGTPIFIGAHRWFPERVRIYTDITAVAGDIPTGSNEYTAAQAFFGQNPAPDQIKIGRRDVDAVTATVVAATTIGQTFTISVTGTDNVKVNASFISATGAETAIAIAAALVTALGTPTGVTVTDNLDGTFDLTKSGVDDFSVSELNLVALTYTVTESAPTALQEIIDEDNDFYFITTHERTQAFILAMAAEAEARKKLYFFAVSEAEGIAALEDPVNANDTLGKVADLGYIQTSGSFYQDDAAYYECGLVGKGAPYNPGTITWDNQRVAGFTDTKDPATGKSLSTTQKNNLVVRNASFTEDVGGLTITRNVKTAAGEWVDVVRSKDFLIARITEAYQNKLINSNKISYTNSGINEMRSVLSTTLDRYINKPESPNILDEDNPYELDFPRAEDVSFADKSARVLNASFTGYLAGAIHVVNIQGILTLNASS